MDRIKVQDDFFLDEFIDPFTYFHESDNGMSLIDEQLFNIAQQLRDCYEKPISINNWWPRYKEMEGILRTSEIVSIIENGGYHIWSGYRSHRCNIGSKHSAHRLGQAIDPKGDEKAFLQIVKDNTCDFYTMGLRRLEDIRITPGWLHMDTLDKNTEYLKIRIVDLTSHVWDIIVKDYV